MDWENLDFLREDLGTGQTQRAINVGVATAFTSAATLGYLVWTVRGSQVLMAAMIASGPNWQVWDPLPVLASAGGRCASDDTSLADIAKKSNQDRDPTKKKTKDEEDVVEPR